MLSEFNLLSHFVIYYETQKTVNTRNTGTYGMLLCSKESVNKVQSEKTNYYKLQTAIMINSFWEHIT